jgi:hypothetical protein
MAIIPNTATTFSGSPGLQGLREDLSDMIYMISPETTPFTSNVGRESCDAVLHEWQTDALAPANVNNAQFQGDDISTFSAASVTARLGNRTQILRKEVIISGTVDAVRKAGRNTELAYQLTKRGKEIKIDHESVLLNNQAKVVGAAATAPLMAGVPAWIKTNVNHVGTNPVGDGSNARVDGTPRAFTEVILKDVLKQIWTNSSEEPDVLMCGGSNKSVASAFTGGAQKTVDVATKKLTATVDIYVGDFASINIISNRWQRPRDAFVLNWNYWAIAWLRRTSQVPLAKTGDAEKRMLIQESTLVSRNEAASGAAYDLTTP